MGYNNEPSTLDAVIVLSVGAIIVGFIFIISGAIVSGIAYTEITPPNYDDNYDRYIGSSVPRLIGPFLLVFGFVIVIGSGVMAGMKSIRQNQKYYSETRMYSSRGMDHHHPDDDDDDDLPQKPYKIDTNP